MPRGMRDRTTRASTRRVARQLATAMGAGAVAGALLIGSASPSDATIDNWNKLSVADAYVNGLQAAESVATAWSGSTSACTAGKPTRATQAATLDAVNFFRELGQLEPVTFSPGLSAKAQKAALIMDANSALSHTPAPSWTCYSATGRNAASHSNLALGLSGARAISGYMSDFGDANEAVGHRRWIMFPATRTMGSGSTPRANALWVIPAVWSRPKGTPTWVSWPTSGYVPAEVEPSGRWSLSATDPRVSFASAKVSVQDSAGHSLEVHRHPVHNGYANQTLAWEVAGLTVPAGTHTLTYRVRVTGIQRSDTRRSLTRSYTVRLFNARSVARVKVTHKPSVRGAAKPGTTLRASPGTWSTKPSSYAFRWLRNGTAVPGATRSTYRLTSADRGMSLTVRVMARKPGLVSGVSESGPLRVR